MASVAITITANREQVREPFLWRLARDFDIKVNVRKANIDSDFGYVLLDLDGAVEEIQRATAWLMTTGMHIEALQRAVGANG